MPAAPAIRPTARPTEGLPARRAEVVEAVLLALHRDDERADLIHQALTEVGLYGGDGGFRSSGLVFLDGLVDLAQLLADELAQAVRRPLLLLIIADQPVQDVERLRQAFESGDSDDM